MNITPTTISTTIDTTLEAAWKFYTEAEHIVQWNFASDDWACPSASVDLQPGGEYKTRMESKDGTMGFDFEAVYSDVSAPEQLSYILTDGRKVNTHFSETSDGILVTTIFDPEDSNDHEMQRAGWQAILDNFKKYAELQMETPPDFE
ncbi:SRPBCC domain-containing protein [Sphingobacterium corticibacter]|uniref:Activator of HSP90 ATPase n=1 Tax=Sphingobacterium corticibacter TaxID=2171749 RepID=A0A2T8HL02_9SPHI|nr:SRPBCC domain-containing protein [Sphingobacterium corticibacter]PVH26121.1 activator of HSP90 ATPase [Sphingobacterium corticibacter]